MKGRKTRRKLGVFARGGEKLIVAVPPYILKRVSFVKERASERDREGGGGRVGGKVHNL